MSQKVLTRARRRTEDESDTKFKLPDSNITKDESLKSSESPSDKGQSLSDSTSKNETAANNENSDVASKRVIQTRSRSSTPLNKHQEDENVKEPKDSLNGIVEESPSKITETEEVSSNAQSNSEAELIPEQQESLLVEKDDEEPLVELQFDENEDAGPEESPVRCKTRRSFTRNVPTPKTPKHSEDIERNPCVLLELLPDSKLEISKTNQVASSNDSNVASTDSQPDEILDLNDTSDTHSSISTDNISTRAVAGSDATRNIDLTYQDSGLFEDNSCTSSPNRSLGETLRNLSSRRTIRPIINEDYRRFAMKNNTESYAGYESIERISSGIKRKNRSISPVDSKRIKRDSPGLLSYFSKPITNLKTGFAKSSTPKLIGYERKCDDFDGDEDVDEISLEIDAEAAPRKWCSIM